jgi:Arc/MetJ family transcription regulator
MRISLDYDDAFWAKTAEATGMKTKKEIVAEALRQLIRSKARSGEREGQHQVRDIDRSP